MKRHRFCKYSRSTLAFVLVCPMIFLVSFSISNESGQSGKHYLTDIINIDKQHSRVMMMNNKGPESKHPKELEHISRAATKQKLFPNKTIVIGILSAANNICNREALRRTIISKLTAYEYLHIEILFLIDKRTTELDEEQSVNGDLVFLNTNETGYNKGFAKKLYIWLRYALSEFPRASLIGRMDDDVFVCTPQIFDRLNEVSNSLLYYGYTTGPGNKSVDEMFLMVGAELARRITERQFCDSYEETNCLHDGNGGHEFTKWIQIYNDVILVDERINKRMLFFYRGNTYREKQYRRHKTINFCEKYLLYHKATVSDIYRMHINNSMYLDDTSLHNVTEEDISNAMRCESHQ